MWTKAFLKIQLQVKKRFPWEEWEGITAQALDKIIE